MVPADRCWDTNYPEILRRIDGSALGKFMRDGVFSLNAPLLDSEKHQSDVTTTGRSSFGGVTNRQAKIFCGLRAFRWQVGRIQGSVLGETGNACLTTGRKADDSGATLGCIRFSPRSNRRRGIGRRVQALRVDTAIAPLHPWLRESPASRLLDHPSGEGVERL